MFFVATLITLQFLIAGSVGDSGEFSKIVIHFLQLIFVFMGFHAEVFLEQPEPVVLVPAGAQVELICRVAMGYRVVWSVMLPGGTSQVPVETALLISSLLPKGIETELSTADNRNPSLLITGTAENNQTAVQCIAVNLSDVFMRCSSRTTTVTAYG